MSLKFTAVRKRISGLELLRAKIAQDYLQGVAQRHIEERGHDLAVFANDLIGISIFLDGVYEREHIETLLTLVQYLDFNAVRGAAIDIGANIGNHSLVFSRHFASVFSYEPHPRTFKLLEMNTSCARKIKAYNIGLGDKAEVVLLHENTLNMGGASAVHYYDNRTIRINVAPLDDLLDPDIPISLIKIDIEGMEYSALKGAIETINKHQPIIAFEQHASSFLQGTTDSIRLLNDLSYVICWIEISNEHSSKNWFLRALSRCKELLVGRDLTYSVAWEGTIPTRSHTMLIAVPERHIAKLRTLMCTTAHSAGRL